MGDATGGEEACTIADVLNRIDHAWAPLAEVAQVLDEGQLGRAGPDGWTVKDHLALVTAWERGLLAVLQRQPRHEAMGVEPDTFARGGADAVNAAVYARQRERPPAEVIGDLLATHSRLRNTIAGMEDANLLRPYSEYQPHEPGAFDDPVVESIGGDTYEHYGEHLKAIRGIVARPDGA